MKFCYLLFLVVLLAYSTESILLTKLLIGKKILIKGKILGKAGLVGAGLGLFGSNQKKCAPKCCNPTVNDAYVAPASQIRKTRQAPLATLTDAATNLVSNGLLGAGSHLRSLSERFERGSEFFNSASTTTRVAGLLARNRLIGSNERSKRNAPRPANLPENFQIPSGKLTLDEMMKFVKQHNAEVCLQRVICQLSSNAKTYGDAGVKFGTSLLNYNHTTHQEAAKYKFAAKIGNQNRNRAQVCTKRFSKCSYDPKQLIAVGNMILSN